MVGVKVQIDDQPPVLVSLDLKEKLSKTRGRLMDEGKMNNILLFATKSKSKGSPLARISRVDEEKFFLGEIIVRKGVIFLYLKSPDYKFLQNKLKLEYGRTVSLDKASKRAFKPINNYEIVNEDPIEINPEEDQMLLTDVPNTIKLAGNSKIKKSNDIVRGTEYRKVKFKSEKLEPTPEFIKAVTDAIDSKDSRTFKKITYEFGQFIPKEVTLGGKAYFKVSSYENATLQTTFSKSTSKNNNYKYECFKLLGGRPISSKELNKTYWAESLNDLKNWDCIRIWTESLNDYRNWDCISIEKPISIFSALREDLREEILLLIGKRILYISTEDYDYELSKSKNYEIFELKNIPKVILKTLRNEDADCSIFATVIGRKGTKNDIFNCQILWPPKEDPKLIIHCIQKKFKEHKCKLKIMLMIIGYDVNFNFNYPDVNFQLKVQRNDFNSSDSQTKLYEELLDLEVGSSYCFGIPVLRKLDSSNDSLVIKHCFFNNGNGRIGTCIFSYCPKKKHYVNLPDFTFYTLIISNYSSNYTGILPLKHNRSIRNLFKISFKRKHKSLTPKYVSLYSTEEDNCGPIFLKQKDDGIKIKYLKCNCNESNCICKNKPFKKLKNNLEYAFFDPYQDNNLMSYMKSIDRLQYWGS